MAKYPQILAGRRMTADILDSMLPDTVTKAATEAVTSSTTLQNDDELFLPVEANATYTMFMFLLHDSATAGDIKIDFTSPTSSVFAWGIHAASTAATTSNTVGSVNMELRTTTATSSFGGGASTGTTAFISGTLTTSGTAGTFQFRWAQDVSSATATQVRQGSYMTLTRIA